VLLEEIAEVLTRPAMTKRLAAAGETAGAITKAYLGAVELVEPIKIPRIARDPDDDHALACARAAHADLIVSGDADLLDLKTFERIPIVSAAEALRKMSVRHSRS
jgi:putative PIN family toxin of toxin-antitoxin system